MIIAFVFVCMYIYMCVRNLSVWHFSFGGFSLFMVFQISKKKQNRFRFIFSVSLLELWSHQASVGLVCLFVLLNLHLIFVFVFSSLKKMSKGKGNEIMVWNWFPVQIPHKKCHKCNTFHFFSSFFPYFLSLYNYYALSTVFLLLLLPFCCVVNILIFLR